jgi:hypothetical protein
MEVVTEGVFTRMILDDPALAGIAAVLFDEFPRAHRSTPIFGLALALDAQARPARGPAHPGDVGDAWTARGWRGSSATRR